jgi:hypothetical protein
MKTKRQKSIIALLMFTMLAMYGSIPAAGEAVSYETIKDTISSSDVSKTGVTHTIVASTTLAVDAGGYLEFVFPAEFTVVATTTLVCPSGGAGHGSGNDLKCVYAAGLAAANLTITVTDVTNPGAIGSYLFHSYNKQADGTIKEHSTFRVAIVNSVLVTATVEASLTFTVSGVASSTGGQVNGVDLTSSSTFKTLAFGVVAPGVAGKKTMAQRLNVSTNAAYGFTVTVEQDHNLLSSNGADMDSFSNGAAASTTPLVWGSPSGVLGQEATYGHFGVTSQDATLSGGANPFDVGNTAKYKGFWGTTPIEVMYSNGPADGTTDDIGSTSVAYSLEISALQEAGDYSSTLTYICTPTY